MSRPRTQLHTSCSRIATVVLNPTLSLIRYDAPIARPSVKLCEKSAMRLRYPATCMSSGGQHFIISKRSQYAQQFKAV